jgi:hypothetical protein
MYRSKETIEQTERRLLKVISKAEFRILDGSYCFEEFSIDELKDKVQNTALAFVRDEYVWSQLVPSQDTAKELFKVISFHFQEDLDNSGFVGWLATYVKQKLGTGVFVTCGQNSNRGGIFDYWGCPYEIEEIFIKEIASLIKKGCNM